MEEHESTLLMNLLYLYASKTAGNMALKGGFPPLYLTPMNFEALYRQQQAMKKSEVPKTVNIKQKGSSYHLNY